MDVFKPRHDLKKVKALIRQGKIASPYMSARQFANELGFSIDEAYQEVLNLEAKDFYKSGTEYQNHKVWQDVYKKKIRGVHTYIKFKVIKQNEFVLTSFKKE